MQTRLVLAVAVLLVAGCTMPAGSGPIDATTESGAATETISASSDHTPGSTPTGSPSTTPAPTTSTTTDSPADGPTPTPYPTPSATFVVEGDPAATVTLEVADDPAERRRGLMGRESLARNHGMLFVYGQERPLTFWMKNTLIPLDMIFVDADRTVVNVAHASIQPNASDDDLRRYHSDGPAKYVIEVNRGFANRTGVGPGTRVRFHGNRSLLTPEG